MQWFKWKLKKNNKLFCCWFLSFQRLWKVKLCASHGRFDTQHNFFLNANSLNCFFFSHYVLLNVWQHGNGKRVWDILHIYEVKNLIPRFQASKWNETHKRLNNNLKCTRLLIATWLLIVEYSHRKQEIQLWLGLNGIKRKFMGAFDTIRVYLFHWREAVEKWCSSLIHIQKCAKLFRVTDVIKDTWLKRFHIQFHISKFPRVWVFGGWDVCVFMERLVTFGYYFWRFR